MAMKKITAVVALFLTVAALSAGGGPTHEEVAKQLLTVMDKISVSLASITSQESADAAKPELRKAAKEFLAVRAQAEKLPPPSREEKNRLEKEFKGKIEAATKKLAGERVRVRNISPGGPEALEEIRSVFDKRLK